MGVSNLGLPGEMLVSCAAPSPWQIHGNSNAGNEF